jgi:deoxyribodipyrimidine photo-lyase
MNWPASLQELTGNPRITIRNREPLRPGGKCVVYWMQRAQRVQENPALDAAIEIANALDLPAVLYFSVMGNFPGANLRHYRFMQQGLRDVAADAAELGAGFVIRRAPEHTLEAFLEEVEAIILIGDENPLRGPEAWRAALAKRLRIPFLTVDADVVVPSAVFNRSFVLLHHFRPYLKRQLDRFLIAGGRPQPVRRWNPGKPPASFDLSRDITEGFTKLDRAIQPVSSFTGGTHAALARLDYFVRHLLTSYAEQRNHPAVDGTSRLSPYLHFGQISPVTIALAVRQAGAEGVCSAETAEKFLDELIGWRELAVLFVRHNPNYDNWECAEPWARKTLIEHASAARPACYTLAQLERAQTHDELWNAAQREMTATGYMHNYMRMYWAKKILEWSPDPAHAFEWAVLLNDRYQLDGRDPNGYAGIAWAIVGKHDRPWFNRPVFGLIRPLSGASIARKTDVAAYIRRNLPA